MGGTRWYYLYIAIIVILLSAVLLINPKHYGVVSEPNPRDVAVQKTLLSEFERLKPLPGAILSGPDQIIREGRGIIALGFFSEMDDADVLAHYDIQFKDNGWSFQEDEAVKYLGFDTGERSVIYTKNQYLAVIDYHYKDEKSGKNRFKLSIIKK